MTLPYIYYTILNILGPVTIPDEGEGGGRLPPYYPTIQAKLLQTIGYPNSYLRKIDAYFNV